MKNFLLAICTLLMLSACKENVETSLKGKTFTLENNKNITISFDAKENRFYGKAVNNYFGEYKIENNNITLSQVGSTMMMGPETEMEKEQKYFNELTKVKTYKLKNKTLELKGDNITIKYLEK